jgi:branched-chain amino acid transport system permease protein
MVEQLLILGVVASAVYALLSLGFTLSFGIARIVNMAHGSFFMLGAYFYFYYGARGFGKLDVFPSLILAAITVAIIGAVFYRLAIHSVMGDDVALIVVTIGGALVFQQAVTIIFGTGHVTINPLMEGAIHISNVAVTYSKILAITISLSLFACISIFISKTKMGRAMKALSQDREAAMLMGINTEALATLTVAIAGAMGAVAGTLIPASTSQMADPFMWTPPLTIAFAVVILGGLGSIKGTLVGALILGFSETAVGLYFPEGGFLKTAVALGVMVTVLLIRPRGLFGKRIELEE